MSGSSPSSSRISVVELVVHRCNERLVEGRGGPVVGEVVHLVGVFPQVVQRHIVVSVQVIDRCWLVVFVDCVIPDELVAAVVDAAHDMTSVEMRVADRFDEALRLVQLALLLQTASSSSPRSIIPEATSAMNSMSTAHNTS